MRPPAWLFVDAKLSGVEDGCLASNWSGWGKPPTQHTVSPSSANGAPDLSSTTGLPGGPSLCSGSSRTGVLATRKSQASAALGLDPQTGAVEVLLSERTKRNAMERICQLTPRQWGGKLESCILQINVWLRGWHGFFGIASPSEQFTLRALDAHIRRRLRAIVLHHWKRRRTIARKLVALGVKRSLAWRGIYAGHKSWWALSHCYPVDQGMRTRFFAERGLRSLIDMHRKTHQVVVAPDPPQLALWG